ncbi:MAG: outer membrane beta-barrel protein [Ferruginibacter sp.]
MKTIKLLLTIAAIFIYFVTYSQISFDLSAGVNIGNLYSKIDGSKQKGLKAAVGYTIPVHINIPIAKSFVLQTGLEYESVRHKFHSSFTFPNSVPSVINSSTNSNLDYINIPLKLYYKLNPLFQVGIGPFIGLGISGKDKITQHINGIGIYESIDEVRNYSNKIKFGSKDSEIKRFNPGLGINLAYTFYKKIIIGLYSNFGLSSINNYDNVKARTFTGGLTMGYRFAKKASK